MASPEALSEILAKSHQALAETLAGAFQNITVKRAPAIRLTKFCGQPNRSSDPTVAGWLSELEAYLRPQNLCEKERVEVALDHLGGSAREEVLCTPEEERDTISKLAALLTLRFGAVDTLGSLNGTFYGRTQLEGETLAEFSRSLMRLYDRMESAADPNGKVALRQLRANALREQFIGGVQGASTKRELHRLSHDNPGTSFHVFRNIVLDYMRDVAPASCPSVQSEGWHNKPCMGNVNVVQAPEKSERELLVGLVEGQQQLASALAGLAQLHRDTNEKIQEWIDAFKASQVVDVQSPKKPRVQCSFCKRVGHTRERCFTRLNQERKQASPQLNAEAAVWKPTSESDKSGNVTPPS